jgi:uncharacterized protein YegL
MPLPGEEMNSRPLHFIWIVNCSSSMAGSKMQSLNTAIREAIPQMRDVAQQNPNAQVHVRAITFSTGARWYISYPTPIERFQWQDAQVGGASDMGKALSMVAEELKMPPMPSRGLPPVLVLITDCYPSDDAEQGIRATMAQPWGQKAVRLGIGIGADADYATLQKFINNPEIAPLRANNAQDLLNYIKWSSTEVPSHKYTALGGELSARPFHFIWLIDRSSFADSSQMQTLNATIREAIPRLQRNVKAYPNLQTYVRVITFAGDTHWHIGQPTPIENLSWQDINTRLADVGVALILVAEQLRIIQPRRAHPPMLVLISDGHFTNNFAMVLAALMEQPLARRATRLAISVNKDANYEALKRFISDPEIEPLYMEDIGGILDYFLKFEDEVISTDITK